LIKKKIMIHRATFKSKEITDIPVGAKILSKELSINVEEIENGFLICKLSNLTYSHNEETCFACITKKYFSKENPLNIITGGEITSDSIADKF